jgi:phosphatidylglycerol:prolipoprotein diacylglycerol transferase
VELPLDHRVLPVNLVSSLLWLAAILVSWAYWSRRKTGRTTYSATVAMGGIAGGLLGAKLGFVIAEAPLWWNDPYFLARMITGKTVLGGLLGGWWGIEIGKRVAGETRMLGDDFARILPLGIAIGRVGCLLHGCCPGRPVRDVLPDLIANWFLNLGIDRWPSAVAEISFQVTWFLVSWLAADVKSLRGQHFHLYLVAYGAFRLVHEFVRDTVRYPGTPCSPYMGLAIVCLVGGGVAFYRRHRKQRNG